MIILSNKKIILFFAAVLCSISAWAYNQSAVDLYFDNSEAKWSSCYVYIGHSSWTSCYALSRVSGTQYLWQLPSNFNGGNSWDGASGWVLCNEKWWDSQGESIDKYTWHGAKNVTKKRTSAWSASYIYKTNGTVSVTSDGNTINAYNTTTVSKKDYTVTINTATGGTLTVKDYDNNAVASGVSKIHLTVLKFSATPADGYVLDGVEINDGTNTTTIAAADLATKTHTLTSNVTINPVWRATTSTVTVTATATNGTVTGGGVVEEGTSVTLTATPDAGYQFVNWTVGGAEVSTANPYTFIAEEDVTVVANFEEIPTHDITVKAFYPASWNAGKAAIHFWGDGVVSPGTPAAMEKDGDWWSYTVTGVPTTSELSVIFINGDNWNGDANQTNDITGITESTCFQITSGSGKASAAVVDCASTPVVAEDVYTVVGSDVLLGTAWDLNNADNEMTKQDDGSYVLVKENVDLATTGTYEYKVVKNHDWGWSVPSGSTNNTLKLGNEDVDGTYNVTFTLNKELNALTASIELVEAKKVIPECYVAGDASLTGQDWNAKSVSMTYDEATEVYTATLTAVPAGTHNMKVVYGGEWLGFDHLATPAPANVKEGDDKKIQFTLAEAGDVTVTYHATNGIGLTGNFAIPVTYDYYIAGTLAGGWSATQQGMEKDGDLYKHTFSALPAGIYEFKVTNGTWTNPWGYNNLGAAYVEVSEGVDGEENPNGNIKFVTEEAKNITVIFDPATGKITLEGLTEKVITYVLMGVNSDWETGIPLVRNEENTEYEEYMLLCQPITKSDAVKVVTLVDGVSTAWCSNVANGSVAVNYDSISGNILLPLGKYDFYYKIRENKVYIGKAACDTTSTPSTPSTYYITGNTSLVGSTNAWIPNAFEMTNNAGSYTYTFSNVAAGDTCMLKVTDGTWNNCWGFEALAEVPAGVRTGDGGNIIFILAETGSVIVTFDGQRITISGNFSTLNLPSYVLMGVDGDWTKGIMLQPYPNNANEYVLQCQDIAAGDAVKVVTIVDSKATEWCGAVKDGSVGCNYDSVGNIVLPTGTYDFYYNWIDKNVYIGSAACVQVIALVGSMNGWNTSASQMRLSNDSTTASVTVMLEAQTYSFKVLCNGEWLGNKWVVTRENCTDWPFESGDGSGIYNCQLTADVAGEYVFTWNIENRTLTVTYPAKGEVYEQTAPDGMRTVYLNTGGSGLWNQGGAKFFAHSWVDDTYAAEQMALYTGDVYKVNIPTTHTHIKFVRMAAGAEEIVWDSNLLWNQTIDLQVPNEKDCYTIRGWGGDQGAWTKYGEEPFPTPLHNYGSSVPSACEDVMLQAFYWDSNQDKYYGCTRWWNLELVADELASNFDLIWLPPSAKSSGGVGYHPKQYSNQHSDWGTPEELALLINRLHDGGAKVIADMVVNHIEGDYGWCGFAVQDFGEYGRFEVDGSYIANSDEMNTDPSAGGCNGQATGGNDDGYGGESNYGAARDFAHTNEKVRQMFRAYAKWMIDVVNYDGFRYDYCKGFHMSHVDDYNANGGAYFSVLEYYDGNPDVLWSRIQDARENTLAFDFGMKYNVLNSGIASFDYSKCKNPDCLIGRGKGKWAVNFIDNHDTFERGNGSDFGGNDPMRNDMTDRLLQANAYILSMPGVPCVFYPHWVAHKDAINAMIRARKAVGVHSESAVSDEVVGNGYRAHVTGSRGILILELGAAVMDSHYGYSEVAAGTGYKMWVTYGSVAPELTIHTNSTIFHTPTMSVTMSVTGGVGTPVIYYTTDGSDPRTSQTRKSYGSAITISGTTVLKVYAEAEGAKSDVQTRVYTYQEPQQNPITIAFQKPNNWSKVYLYSWDNKENYLTGTWPGMELTEKNAAGLYYHTYGSSYDGGVNFIISNGSDKSVDLHTYEDVCYGWKNDKAVVVQCSEEAGLIIYHDGTYNPGDGVYEVSEEYVGSITYKRIFTPGKWETIYFPFAVEKVTVEDGGEWKLNPWTKDDGGEYFLAAPGEVWNGEIIFDMVDKLDIKQPYIIQFPIIDGYEDYYVNRVITFHGSAKWNELPSTFAEPDAALDMQMYGNTTLKQKALVDDVYMLRGTDDFILYSSTVLQPFECYVTPKKAGSVALTQKMKVRFRGEDDVTTPILSTYAQPNALKYMKTDNVLTLYTCGQAVQIYSVNGVMLYSVEAGQEVVEFTLPNGCYVLSSNGNSQKIIM